MRRRFRVRKQKAKSKRYLFSSGAEPSEAGEAGEADGADEADEADEAEPNRIYICIYYNSQ